LAFDEKASMPQRSLSPVSGILALAVTASFLPPLVATADDAAATGAFIDEVRHSFTLKGKPIPPEIFRDFGDGDLAGSGSIWVTVDVKAAIGSNLYFDDIKQNGSWINQKKATSNEETGYTHFGTTENRLLVVLSAFSGDVVVAPPFSGWPRIFPSSGWASSTSPGSTNGGYGLGFAPRFRANHEA
jgi:hypothetical protein